MSALVKCLQCGQQWDFMTSIHICPRPTTPTMLSSTTLEDRVRFLEARVVILEHALATQPSGEDK